jgi:hypothetical protein
VNNARVTADVGGQPRVLKEEVLDPLPGLYTPGPGPHATVGFTVGRSLGYGEIKVSAYVSYECDQVEATVNRTGELAFGKALEMMNDGFEILTKETPG